MMTKTYEMLCTEADGAHDTYVAAQAAYVTAAHVAAAEPTCVAAQATYDEAARVAAAAFVVYLDADDAAEAAATFVVYLDADDAAAARAAAEVKP